MHQMVDHVSAAKQHRDTNQNRIRNGMTDSYLLLVLAK